MNGIDAIMSGTNAISAMKIDSHAQRMEKARDAAEELVSISLVQPILKELRDTNRATGPFAPGAGEKAFGPLLDAAMAKQIVSAQGFNVVDAVAEKMGNSGSAMAAWSRARAETGTGLELGDHR